MIRRPALDRGGSTTLRVAGAASALCALVLTGCGMTGQADIGAAASESPAAEATPSRAPTSALDPALDLAGSAYDNLAHFEAIVASVWAGSDRASGRAYIDALASGGFDRADMQVTDDESTVGNPAESLQFSVRWGEECLIGQVGPATGDPVTAVLPALPDGACLVGDTRPIDW